MLEILGIIMVSLVALDVGLSYYGLKSGCPEKNPIAKFGFKHIGFIPLAIAKLLITIGVARLCIWFQDGILFLLGLIIYSLLMALWNIYALTHPITTILTKLGE